MARKSQPPEPAQPVLKESQNSARAKVLDRLTKGADLKARVVQSQEEAEAFNKDYKEWDDYNEALLTSLFTDDTPASL